MLNITNLSKTFNMERITKQEYLMILTFMLTRENVPAYWGQTGAAKAPCST